MMIVVRIVAFLHLAVYLGIMWYGWQSYKLLRRPSWKVMGIGFAVLLVYRLRQFIRQMFADYAIDAENTLLPFIGGCFLLVAFRMLSREHARLISILGEPITLRSGAQPVEYWLANFRMIREEIATMREEVTSALKAIKEKLNGR